MLLASHPRLRLLFGLVIYAGISALAIRGREVPLMPVIIWGGVMLIAGAPSAFAWPEYAPIREREIGAPATPDELMLLQFSPLLNAMGLVLGGIALMASFTLEAQELTALLGKDSGRLFWLETAAVAFGLLMIVAGLAIVPIAKRRQPLYPAQNRYLKAAWSVGPRRSELLGQTAVLERLHRTKVSS